MVAGAGGGKYSVYVGDDVQAGEGVLIHEPTLVGSGAKLGDGVVVFKARVGDGAKVGENSIILRDVAAGEKTTAGMVLTPDGDYARD